MAQQTYNDRNRAKLESVPAKSPHRKYLVLLAMQMIHTDDALVLSEAADCSERTFHYVKSRLSKQDGVIFNYDRSAGRYVVIQSGVLDLPRIAELMKRHYPERYAFIRNLSKNTYPSREEQALALRRAS
jgi:hypothetical protein